MNLISLRVCSLPLFPILLLNLSVPFLSQTKTIRLFAHLGARSKFLFGRCAIATLLSIVKTHQ